eukprot:6186267-Pleurochrysis_carterae.AAC.4
MSLYTIHDSLAQTPHVTLFDESCGQQRGKRNVSWQRAVSASGSMGLRCFNGPTLQSTMSFTFNISTIYLPGAKILQRSNSAKYNVTY